MTDTKKCVGCGNRFERREVDTNSKWDRRSYCSKGCAGRNVMRDPAVAASHKAAVNAKFANDPDYRERHRAAASVNGKKGVANRNPKKQGESLTRNKIGCIPSEWLPHYRKLRELYGAARAKAMVAEARRVEAGRVIAKIANDQAEREARRKRDAY